MKFHSAQGFIRIVAAILVLFAADGLQAADAKTAFRDRVAAVEAQQQIDGQLRMLMPNWIFAWRLPLGEGEFETRRHPRTIRGMFPIHAGEIHWDGALEIVAENANIFSERYRKTRLVLTIEGVIFDPNDSRYWFQSRSS